MRYETHKNLSSYHTPTPQVVTKAYLLGVLHDSTERKYTYRISQKSKSYLQILSRGIKLLGFKSWIYKEGKNRNVYILEFSKKLLSEFKILTSKDKIDYIRGYFDTDGSIPSLTMSRYYIYFAQKDYKDLEQVKEYLQELDIFCGRLHNPSSKIDSDYFRFYVLSNSYNKFATTVGSYHPEKSKRLRMKI